MTWLYPSTEFRELVSGRRRGPAASLLRSLLRVAEEPYAWAVRWRNHRFDVGKSPVYSAGVPVVSVGNLTLGGTGKTPMVQWLARWLASRQIPIALISRGYGSKNGEKNDEALEMDLALPGVPHLLNADRAAAARIAVRELGCRLILLDDAFQHRRIRRDLDIVLVDALEPFGFDHVFPRGSLREPISGLNRADIIALSRADLVDRRRRDEIRDRVNQFASSATWAELGHVARGLQSTTGDRVPSETLAGSPIAAFCGVGNPTSFRETLRAGGYRIKGLREFPDHHRYSAKDLASLDQWIKEIGPVEAVLCTQKDLVKLDTPTLGGVPLWALKIELTFLEGQPAVEEHLERLCITAQPND